jgi:dehydrogenase/reductase SDR family protein 7B
MVSPRENLQEKKKNDECRRSSQAHSESHLTKKTGLILTRQGKLAVFLNKWIPGLMDTMVYNVWLRKRIHHSNNCKDLNKVNWEFNSRQKS